METLTLDEVFSPSTPITRENFFVGRFHELQAMQIAANEPGKHVLLYGERGVGKTSLVNMLIAKTTEQKIIKKSVHREDSFSTIWQALLSETQVQSSLSRLLAKNDSEITMTNLQHLLAAISEKTTFIIDEFDLLAGTKNSSLFASLLKYLSDNHPNITLILVGIATRVSTLIEQHASLERCFVDFFLPRMTEREITDLVELGGRKAGFNFHTDALKKILNFSGGYPYYAHMIAKFSCMHASEIQYKTVTVLNYTAGVKLATLSLRSLLDKQIAKALRGKNLSYRNITEGAAQLLLRNNTFTGAQKNNSNSFSATELSYFLKREQREEKNIHYYLKKLSSLTRGELLQTIHFDDDTLHYKFKNPLVKNVLQKSLTSKNL